jgi:hypothetical protein
MSFILSSINQSTFNHGHVILICLELPLLKLMWFYLLLDLLNCNDASGTNVLIPSDTLPSPKLGPRWALVFKTAELWGLEGTLPVPNTKRGRWACWSSGMGLRRGTSFSYSIKPASNQPTSWLVRILEHP